MKTGLRQRIVGRSVAGLMFAVIGFILARPVFAQDNAADTGATESRPAPLALPDDFEPAVDVGGPAAAPPAPPSPAAPSAPAAAGRPMATIDSLDLGTTSITGNQELPKVLYIVPWKSSELGDLAGRTVNTLLDEALSPIDPEVFERQLSYFDSLYGTTVKE